MHARLFSAAARCSPQPGQTKPPDQRRFNKNAAQLASRGNNGRLEQRLNCALLEMDSNNPLHFPISPRPIDCLYLGFN